MLRVFEVFDGDRAIISTRGSRRVKLADGGRIIEVLQTADENADLAKGLRPTAKVSVERYKPTVEKPLKVKREHRPVRTSV